MTTLTEIEAAVDALPIAQKRKLFEYLEAQLSEPSAPPAAPGHGVMDIAPVHVGSILGPFSGDDDLLKEMLEGRKDARPTP